MARLTRSEFGSAISRGAQGAQLGSLIPGLGTLAGAGIGLGVGFAEGLFGEDPFEERERRKAELVKEVRRLKTESIQRFERDISNQTAGAAGSARQAAGRRAAAAGREEDVEAFIAPIEQGIFSQASKLRSSGVRALEDKFADMEAQIESDYAGRPIEPSVGDMLTEVGEGVIGYLGAEKAVKSQEAFQSRWLDILNTHAQGKTNANPATNTSMGNINLIPDDFWSFNIPTIRNKPAYGFQYMPGAVGR